jgi:hypothetical protein
MVEQIEHFLKLFETLKTQTPWQLHNHGGYLEKVESIYLGNSFLGLYETNPRKIFQLYNEVKTQTGALITVAAILHFKENNHHLPTSLEELVTAGYLKSIPMDPYSNGPLVYKLDKDNFKLYSVGEDFSDDGGIIEVRKRQEPRIKGGTYMAPYIYAPDIVYWPVNRFGHLRKELEKLKAEKEAESQEKIEEANQPK